MEIKKSPLVIIDYAVLNITFNAILCEEEEEKELDIYNYPIEIDFGLDEDENDIKTFFIKVWSNFDDNPDPGYSFSLETVTFFRIENKKDLNEQTISNLNTYSILSIAYSNLRGILNNISINGPFGAFILPSVDLQDLMIKKQKEVLAEKKS